MAVKKYISVVLFLVLFLAWLMPDAQAARGFAGRGIARAATVTAPGRTARRHLRSHRGSGGRGVLNRRILAERSSIVRARIKSSDTPISDDIARIGRSHSMTRQVRFPSASRSRRTSRIIRPHKPKRRPNIHHRRRFRRRPPIDRERHFRIRVRIGRPSGLRYRPGIGKNLRFRHRRFHRRPGIRNRRHFYYYSLPYFTYFYYVPPYYYSIPYRSYFDRGYDRETRELEEYEKPAEQFEEPPEQFDRPDEVAKVNEYLGSVAEAFAAGDYAKAVRRGAEATEDKPDNLVLLFVYSQALFAHAQYSEAADVLLSALSRADVEAEGVFYPMGFYPDEEVLTDQIADLAETAEAVPSSAELQLLLGYQLLGVGDYEQALAALQAARAEPNTEKAAALLIEVLNKTTEVH